MARAIASRTAEQAADNYESRLEPGTVIAPSGTMTIAPRSDEMFGEPAREVASAGSAVVPIVIDHEPSMPARMSEPPRGRQRPRWVLPVAAAASALFAAILVWWTLGPSAAQSDEQVRAEPELVAAVADPPATAVEHDEAAAPKGEAELDLEPDPVAAPEPDDPVMTFAPEPAPSPGARQRPRGKGFFTIDSMPYATIFVDGAKKGVTPLLRLSLSAGKHEVVAVTADGRRQKFQIAIAPGEEAKRRKLTW